jgi:ferric-dicitrate binding protein FerR (iron transport regulator)
MPSAQKFMEARIKYLFRQYLENKCTRREFDEFFALLRNAATDKTLRQLISNAYTETGKGSFTYVDESGNLVLPEPEWFSRPVPEETELPVKKQRKIYWAVAAMAVGVACIFLFQSQPGSNENIRSSLQVRSTERSEFKYLLLPDSTQVWLNAASTLEYPPEFGGSKREVFLSGEAYFDVKHAAKIPFIIHTGKISTTVLGTAFNIKAYDDLSNVTVAVSRGKVKVEYLDKEVATLMPGQQVKVNNNGTGIADRKSGINQVAAWQQGNLVYDDESIMDIVADLERMYNVRIKVSDITVNNMRISTSFNRQTGVEQALQILCSLTDRKMEQRNGQYFIY